MSIKYEQLPWTSRFVRDYCHAFDQLGDFFLGSPVSSTSWAKAFEARRSHRPDRAVADALIEQLQKRGAPSAAQNCASQLRDDRAVAVVTGQQAGLFGGPFFTLLKALTTIKLARRLAEEHQTPIVPLFWIDAEDHDLSEIANCQVLDASLAPVQVTLPIDSVPGTTAASVELNDSIISTVSHLRDALAPTEFTEEIFAALAQVYTPGVRLVDAFARWLDRILGHHGLVVYDASDPATKPLVRALFARELEAPGKTAQLATRAGAALKSKGYHAQVSIENDMVALFRLNVVRQPIRLTDSGFLTGGQTLSADDMLAELRSDPSSFSPNVLLRPITQDTLFPTVAYVAGPNELAYLGQLRQVYATFDVPMPVVYPRASVTVVDNATVKFLTRYEMEFGRLQAQDESGLNALLSSQLPAEVDLAATAVEREIADRLAALAVTVQTIDPTLAGTLASTRSQMERELRNLRAKIIQAAKRRDKTLRRQFNRTRAQSFPAGAPQERSIAGIYLLNQHGFAFVDRLLEKLPLEPGRHWLLTG